jgi:Spy/CpxP family protein refolding chaperone
MFGIILGTLCLVALVATVRGRRYARHGYGFHRSWMADDGPPWRDSWRVHHARPRDLLRELFIRLDTTPGQEKAIVAALEHARERARSVKGELKETRRRVAALLGSDVLDRAALEERLSEPKAVVDTLRGELLQTLAAIHEVLDQRQRRLLSELIADGSIGRAPYFGC